MEVIDCGRDITYSRTSDKKIWRSSHLAPAVSKGNDTLLDWVNEEIKSLGDEQFFHKDYEETLVDTYGKDYEEDLVVEGGAVQ